MLLRLLIFAPMFAMLIWAAAQDLRCRRIRNWLTLALAAGGIANSFASDLAIPPGQAVLGLAAGFALTFVLFALGALGGGDVKLMAGVGSWLGPSGALAVFVAAALVGLAIVLGQCAWQGRLRVLFRNSAVLAINLAHLGDVGLDHTAATGKASRSVDRPLPYAVPVLIGALLVVALA